MTQDLKHRLHAYFSNKPNLTEEEQLLLKELRNELSFFEVASVAREDLSNSGFDTSNISDSKMERIASKMGDAYVENGFWVDLDIIAGFEGVPKNNSKHQRLIKQED